MGIELVRIDDRLIHGQVVVGWVKKMGAECILVCDDEAAQDPLQRELMQMAVPSQITLFILTVQDTFKKIKEGAFKDACTILLLSSPFALLRLTNMGAFFPSINIGGIREREGRRMIFPQVHLTEEEAMGLLLLVKMGAQIFVQMVPGEQPQYIEKRIREVFCV